MITAVSADGTDVRAFDEGHGPVILIIHPGLDDGRSWQKVARRLAGRFRVVRIVRRHYRVDIPAASCYSMAKEVEDVLALAELLGEPIVIVGHSSGAVVALEALAAAPATFAGAVLYEPPVATGPAPEGGAIELAKAAIAAGKPGKAMQIFVRDVVGMPASQAWLIRPLTAVIPKMRSLAPRQITDLEGLGPRLDVYAQIGTPTVLLGGERSPAHLGDSLDALAGVMPGSQKVILARRGHSAHLKAAREVAHVIETLAGKVLPNR
jgi:pimeloyl-ACP methyl ester carboxylesterase